jgi:hypothetical protein
MLTRLQICPRLSFEPHVLQRFLVAFCLRRDACAASA